MAQTLLTQQAGLITSPNPFGSAPSGGLAAADNCLIKDAGILESRRGLGMHSALSGGQRLSSFLGSLVAFTSATSNNAFYYSGSIWVPVGTVPKPSGSPVRTFLAAKNLYAMGAAGLQRLSTFATGFVPATLPRPRNPTTTTSTLTPSFLPVGYSVAYVALYAAPDGNGTFHLGIPSQPATVTNGAGSPLQVAVTLALDPTNTAGQILRFYRTTSILGSTPTAQYFLSLERVLTAADISAGFVTYTDTMPDANLGVELYTNADQEGAGEENDNAPLAVDSCVFKGITIYANVTDKHRLLLTLREVNTPTGLLQQDFVTIAVNGGSSYQFVATAAQGGSGTNWTFDVSSGVVTTSLNSLAASITAAGIPGMTCTRIGGNQILLEEIGFGGAGWTVSFGANVLNVPAGNLVRTAGTFVAVTEANNYAKGSSVILNASPPDAAFPVGVKVSISSTGGPPPTQWGYQESGANATSAHAYTTQHFQPYSAWSGAADGAVPGVLPSDNSKDPAGLRYGKYNQPEACPLQDADTVGVPGQPIYRVFALRDSVLIFKADGIYKLNGSTVADFSITPYDLTTVLALPDAAVAMADNVLCVTTKGPMVISESAGVLPMGPPGMDCPIRETILSLMATSSQAPSLCFGTAYESEKLYLLYVNDSDSNTAATQAYVFNLGTLTWTRWTTPAVHSIIDPTTNRLFATDGTSVFGERKGFVPTDYQDLSTTATITAVTDTTHVTTSGFTFNVGDLVTQGGNSARVVSVAGSALTLDTAATWTTGASAVAQAIQCRVTYLPFAGGENAAGLAHSYQEVSFSFRSLPAPWVNATFASDVDPSTENVFAYAVPSKPANVNIRVGSPRNKSRAVMLSAGFLHQSALNNFQLQSTSILYRAVSSRTPAHGKSG